VNSPDLLADLERLIREGKLLSESARDHLDPDFRRWRHESESLVAAIGSFGMTLAGPYKSGGRFYQAGYIGATPAEQRAAFRRDLSDSIIELEFIAKNFGRFDPKPGRDGEVAKAAPLEMPESVTFAWLFRNVPVRIWFSFGALLVAAFLLGVRVANTPLFEQLAQFLGASANGHAP